MFNIAIKTVEYYRLCSGSSPPASFAIIERKKIETDLITVLNVNDFSQDVLDDRA